MADDHAPEAIMRALSAPRFDPYLRAANGQAEDALRLYEWGARMSSAAFELVAHVEVVMRNAIDQALSAHFQDERRGIPWFLSQPPLDAEALRQIAEVRSRLRLQGRDTRAQLIGGLTFGFWSGMLGTKYEELWRSAIRHAFPGGDGTRKQAAVLAEAIRRFRNRLAHHDSMLNLDIPFEVQRVHSMAHLLGPEIGAWLESVDRTAQVYSERPVALVDTVVVGARNAWPFYLQNFAYVCQPGRWFRPVERMAFYADRAIQQEIPSIIHRRDHVVWTDENAAMLAASDDRMDKKVATVIRAARAAGWTEGSYQVFILSRDGSPDHRRIPAPIPHTTSGRGSGFTQRQRYVSLHSLQTAQNTADL